MKIMKRDIDIIYIYIRAIIVVRRWTIHCAYQRKCKNGFYQKSKKLKAGFFQATWLVPPGQTIWNKCVFRCDFNCSLATVISVQLQSTEHWHYPRLSVQCFQRCVHVQGTLSSHPQPPTMISVATQNKWRSIKDVYMCKERCHPIPNPTPPHPPHFGHRRTTTIAGIYIYMISYQLAISNHQPTQCSITTALSRWRISYSMQSRHHLRNLSTLKNQLGHSVVL